MNKNIKASIIIPAYNASLCISETLDSVLQQLHKNIEIIIIDDNSSDDTWGVIGNYSNKYPKIIKIYKNKRKGACAARNYGFELSSGDFILYLDADDILSNNKLSSQLDLLAKANDPLAISVSRWQHFEYKIDDAVENKMFVCRDYNPAYLVLLDMWTYGEMLQTSCWLVPRSIIELIDGWNETFKSNPTDDSEFFTKVVLKSSKIVYDSLGVVFYRRPVVGGINLSQSRNYESIKSIIKTYQSYELILEFDSSEVVKIGLANNYLNFIYEFYPLFPDLLKKAEDSFYNLGYKKMWPAGGENFKKIASILGFKNTLIMRNTIKRFF